MKNHISTNQFLKLIVDEKIYPNKRNLVFHLDSIFNGIDFTDKKFLDIGGGIGLHSFYAASKGAKEVLCLEPEAEGCQNRTSQKFRSLNRKLGYKNVRLENSTLQDYTFQDKFDIISLHDSINHLDEESCINLLADKCYYNTYKVIFSKLYDIANENARIIICDCSRYNFFAGLKINNPYLPTIEWEKHQSPKTWSGLLIEVGFKSPVIKWLSFNSLGKAGNFFLGNKIASYFMHSHFCLTMHK